MTKLFNSDLFLYTVRMTSEKRQLFSSTALRQEKINTQFAQLNNGFLEYRAKKVKMKMKEFYSYLLQEHLQHKQNTRIA